MKRRELKNMIKAAALSSMPDVFTKIDLASAPIGEAREREIFVRPRIRLGYAGVLKFALVAILAGITGVFVYNELKNDPPVVMALETEAEVYGFQMVSATSLLTQIDLSDPLSITLNNGDNHPTTMNPGGPGPGGTTTTEPDAGITTAAAGEALVATRIDTVTRYLNAMEVMLAEKAETVYEIVPSTIAGYAWRLTFTTVDLLGNALVYEIHYNETIDPEDENRRLIAGVMTFGGDTYQLDGTATIEGETVRTAFRAAVDDDHYIRVTDQTDDAGQKFRYEVVDDGVATHAMTMKLAREDDDLVATIDWADASEEGTFRFRKIITDDGVGFEIRYRFEYQGDAETGRMTVAVEYDDESASYQYRYGVDVETGNHAGHADFAGNRTDKTSGHGRSKAPDSL